MILHFNKTNKYFYLSVINKYSGNILITKSFSNKEVYKSKVILEFLQEAGIQNIILESSGNEKFHGNFIKIFSNICGDSSIGRV